MIDNAKADRNRKHSYETAFNMSKFGLLNPIEAQEGMSGRIERFLSPDNVGRGGAYRVGTVKLDFYEKNLGAVHNLIRSNPGCGNL